MRTGKLMRADIPSAITSLLCCVIPMLRQIARAGDAASSVTRN